MTYRIDGGSEINGIHFLLASVHPELKYFEIRMCRLTALLKLVGSEPGVFIGSDTYEFLLRCVMKVWSYQLTENFVTDFEESWYEFKMVPDIAVPLTPWGVTVLEHLWTTPESYLDADELPAARGQDARKLARTISRVAQRASEQLDRSDRPGETPR